MNNAQITTGKQFNIGGVTVRQVKVEPCFRLVAIGKGLPQYCQCTSCRPRGDLGRLVQPV